MARRFVPDWRLWVLAAMFLPLLVGLGVWQLGRAQEKAELLALWQSPQGRQPWARALAGTARAGQPVRLRGQYTRYTWLLDNRTRGGQPGYEVLTAFEPETGGPLLVVNRGWVAAPRTRARLPVIHTPAGPVMLDARLADYPVPPVLSSEGSGHEGTWPRRVQALPAAVAAQSVGPVAPLVAALETAGQPGAFRPRPAPDIMGPQTHYGYAAQWFALALALTILTVAASFRKTTTGANHHGATG